MDPQNRSELLKQMRFQFLFEKQWIVTRLSDPEQKRVPNLGAWDSEHHCVSFQYFT